MTIPTYEELMLPLLKEVQNQPLSNSEITIKLAKIFNLTDENLEEKNTGGAPKFYNRAQWAKTYLKQAGLVSNPSRGIVEITDEGKKVLAQKVSKIDNKFLATYTPFLEFKNRKKDGEIEATEKQSDLVSEQTPEEEIESAFLRLKDSLKSELLDKILASSPMFFEQLIVDLLIAMGYGGSRKEAGERIGKSGDGGIDGTIKEDPLGLDIIYLQAKRYAKDNTVGRPDIQKFIGSLSGEGATKGVFVTTSSFTKEAKDYLNRVQHRVILIDGYDLTEHMINYGVGLREVNTLKIQKIDDDYFEMI